MTCKSHDNYAKLFGNLARDRERAVESLLLISLVVDSHACCGQPS